MLIGDSGPAILCPACHKKPAVPPGGPNPLGAVAPVTVGEVRVDLSGLRGIRIGDGKVDEVDVLVPGVDLLNLQPGRHHQQSA